MAYGIVATAAKMAVFMGFLAVVLFWVNNGDRLAEAPVQQQQEPTTWLSPSKLLEYLNFK